MTDLVITAANVLAAAGAQIVQATSSVAVTTGQSVYLDTTTNTVKLANAVTSAATGKLYGIALNGTPGTGGQPISVLVGGNYNPGATVVVGKIYVLSATNGGIAPEADLVATWFTNVLGIATTTTNILVGILNGGVAHA